MLSRSSGHRTVGRQYVAVKRYDSETETVFFSDIGRVFDRIYNQRISEKEFDYVVEIFIVRNKICRKTQRASFVLSGSRIRSVRSRLHGRYGKESNSSAFGTFKEIDEVLRVVGSCGYNVLHRAAETRFYRGFILRVRFDEVCNYAFYSLSHFGIALSAV